MNKCLIINSGINPGTLNKCLKLIKKEVKDMAKGNFELEKVEEAKITYLNSLKEIYDSPRSIVSTFVSHEYMDTDLIDEREEKINSVTYEDILEFAKKVHIDTVYVLEGGEEVE